MQYPVYIHIAGNRILLHGLLEAMGIFIAMRYYYFLKRKQGDILESSTRLFLLVASIFGALFGSHIIGALENIHEWLHAPNFWLYLVENKTIAGGLAGGIVLVEVTKKMLKINQHSGDLYVYPILLGLSIGRLGCLSMGVHEMTYGTTTTLFTGMNLGDGIMRHPVTLYEIIYLLLLWPTLKWLSNNLNLINGARFKLLILAYFTFRFLIEFIKPTYKYALGLDAIQYLSIGMFIYYYRYLIQPKLLIKIN